MHVEGPEKNSQGKQLGIVRLCVMSVRLVTGTSPSIKSL